MRAAAYCERGRAEIDQRDLRPIGRPRAVIEQVAGADADIDVACAGMTVIQREHALGATAPQHACREGQDDRVIGLQQPRRVDRSAGRDIVGRWLGVRHPCTFPHRALARERSACDEFWTSAPSVDHHPHDRSPDERDTGPGHPGRRACEALHRQGGNRRGRARRGPRGLRRRDLRLPRAQRGRQVDDRAHAHDAADDHRRPCGGRRRGHRARPRRRAAQDRRRAAGGRPGPAPDRSRAARPARAAVRAQRVRRRRSARRSCSRSSRSRTPPTA